MLVECRCGKKLNVKESLIGKKVRCPKCENVFVAEAEGDEPVVELVEEITPTESRPERDEPQRPRKKKARRDDDFDDEDDDEDDDRDEDDDEDEDARPSARKRRQGKEKKGVSLARNIIAGVVLLTLLAVGAYILIQKLAPSGTVVLNINTTNVEVFVDGKKVDYPPLVGDTLTVTLDLSPGKYELKVSKHDFVPFMREVEVVSEKKQTISVNLKKK